jgi:hypothetical protein
MQISPITSSATNLPTGATDNGALSLIPEPVAAVSVSGSSSIVFITSTLSDPGATATALGDANAAAESADPGREGGDRRHHDDPSKLSPLAQQLLIAFGSLGMFFFGFEPHALAVASADPMVLKVLLRLLALVPGSSGAG